MVEVPEPQRVAADVGKLKIVIIDTGVANNQSVRNAFDYLGCDVEVSYDPQTIRDAHKLVFPGVGAFPAGISSVRSRGLDEVLGREIEKGKPVLGICLGYQMMAELGLEDGEFQGLGWIPGRVERILSTSPDIKVPHMGFNTVTARAGSRLFVGIETADFYFVHSYHLVTRPDMVAATVDHGGPLCAAIESGNLMGVQFHPEKSQSAGLCLLRNFLAVE